jgi:hypothetical protein
MVRLVLIVSAALILTAPAAAQTAKENEEAAAAQEGLARKFRDFEQALLRLTQRMEQSSKPADQQKAKVLRKAVDTASKEGTDLKFAKLIQLLRTSHALDGNLNDLEAVLRQNKMVAADIQALLKLLLENDRLAQLKAELDWYAAMLETLDRLIAEQKRIRSRLDAGRTGLDKEQPPVTKDTEGLADMIKERFGDDDAAGKHVRAATDKQRNAQVKLEGTKPGDALADIDQAIKDLEDARRDFRDRHNHAHHQHRDLLREQLLALLQRMLTGETAVREGTVRLHTDAAGEPLTRGQRQQALHLSDAQGKIHIDTKELLKLLEMEGSAVVFAEVAKQVHDDVVIIEDRLNRADVGDLTQRIETDVIDTVSEMIAALRRAQQAANQPPPDGPGGDGPTIQRPLVDLLTELKTIRFMQVRVNDRTAAYSQKFEGEQADDADVRRELKGLAGRQQKIIHMTQELPKKK